MADHEQKGPKRPRDDGLELRVEGTDEHVPKRTKKESPHPTSWPSPVQDGGSTRGNGTLAESALPRRPSQTPVGTSSEPSASVAIRAIQEMNGGASISARTTARIPSGPNIFRNNRIPSLIPRNTVRKVQVPIRSVGRPDGPAVSSQPRGGSRNNSSSSSGPARGKSKEVTKLSNASLNNQTARPLLSRAPKYEGKHTTESPSPTIGEDNDAGHAAAVTAITAGLADTDSDTKDFVPIKREPSETMAKDFVPIKREPGETMEDFRKRQLDSIGSSAPPRLEKRRAGETMEDFLARKKAHYEKYNLDKTGKVKEEDTEDDSGQDGHKKNNPKAKYLSGLPPRFLQSDERLLNYSMQPKPREGFNIGPLIDMNAGRDPNGGGIEFPAELLEMLEAGINNSMVHWDNVFLVAIEQNRRFAFFHIPASSQRMEIANHLALSFFRSEVPKILPELHESPGLDHEEEKSSLAQLADDPNRKRWTKDIWYRATGDIRGDARLSWYVEREGESVGLVTLSAALPGTDYQVTVKVQRQKLVQ